MMKLKEKIKKAFKKAPKKILTPVLTVVIVLIAIFFLDSLLPKWQISKRKPKTEEKITEALIVAKKTEATETPTPVVEPVQKEEAREAKIAKNPFEEPLIVGDVERLAKRVAALEAKQTVREKTKKAEITPKVEITQKVESKEVKTEAPQNVTAEELYKAIQKLQTESTIRTQEDLNRINWQIAELRNQIAEIQYQQSQEPEVIEYHHYYQRRWWPYYSQLIGMYCFLGPYPYLYNPLHYYYSNRYPPQNPNARWYVQKNQLSDRQTIRNYPSRQTNSSNVKVQSKVPGKFQTPWGDSRNFGKNPSKVSPNSKTVSISSNRTGIRTISGSSGRIRTSGRISSTRTSSTRSTKVTRIKIKKK